MIRRIRLNSWCVFSISIKNTSVIRLIIHGLYLRGISIQEWITLRYMGSWAHLTKVSPDGPVDITTFVPQDLKVKFSQHFHAAVHHQFTMNRTATILCVVLLIFFIKGQLISDNFFYNTPKNQRVF